MERVNLSLPYISEQKYDFFDPIVFAQSKVDTINHSAGDRKGYDCVDCLNRGYIAHLREDGSMYTSPCKCISIRRCIREMEASGLKNVIKKYTFENFLDAEPWQKSVKQGAMAYADDPNGWLLFCGQSGSGKTHLCTAVCRHRLLEGDEVKYAPWRETAAQLKGLSLESEKRLKIMNDLQTVHILFMDDLFKVGKSSDGSTNPTAADVSIAFEILNYRYVNRLVTIISTEKTPQDLVDIDEATGSRILEMAEEHTFSIKKDRKRNYRLRSAVAV